jgi:hypothetical protein
MALHERHLLPTSTLEMKLKGLIKDLQHLPLPSLKAATKRVLFVPTPGLVAPIPTSIVKMSLTMMA